MSLCTWFLFIAATYTFALSCPPFTSSSFCPCCARTRALFHRDPVGVFFIAVEHSAGNVERAAERRTLRTNVEQTRSLVKVALLTIASASTFLGLPPLRGCVCVYPWNHRDPFGLFRFDFNFEGAGGGAKWGVSGQRRHPPPGCKRTCTCDNTPLFHRCGLLPWCFA